MKACLGISLLMIAASGCTPPAAPVAQVPEPVTVDFPLTITDSIGRKITLTHPPRRIVSLAPSNTEILFAIGAGADVIGVTTYDDYPPEVKKRDLVGGFLPKSVSLEKIVGLKSDLVLIAAGVQTPLIDSIERLHIPIAVLDAHTLDEVYANMRILGRITGRQANADRCVAEMRARVDKVRVRAASIPPERRPTVFYMLWEEPLMTVGPKTFISQMIELAGGRNLFPDLQQEFPRISSEEVLRRNPEVILAADHGEQEKARARLLERSSWQTLRAVKHQRIGFIDEAIISRPGPRVVEGLEAISGIVHE